MSARLLRFLKLALAKIIWSGGALQVFAYLLGIYDEVYAWIVSHRGVVVIGMLVYVFVYWMVYDAELLRQRHKYNQRLKGASIRRPSRKK